MQNSTISPWGAQDKFMAHFIVRKDVGDKILDHTARTILKTHGRFADKKVLGITWNGGIIADILNQDIELSDMIIKQSVHDATIFIEPTESGVRIYGKWKNLYDFKITAELFKIYEQIAKHVKSI